MNKIICDVCGTSYPDTATQCPICGCMRPSDIITVSGDANAAESQPSGAVKGGRFSKANVRKRNKGKVYLPEDSLEMDERLSGSESNRGIMIALILLLIAIVAVIIYIVIQLAGQKEDYGTAPVARPTSATVQQATESTQPDTIACTDIKVPEQIIELKGNASRVLNVKPVPENTTFDVKFTSSDESVVTVTDGGKITAVGPGSAVITIECGDIEKQCDVLCKFETEQETEPTEPTVQVVPFELRHEEFTFQYYGEEVTLYSGDIPADQIKWRSSDPEQVQIVDGVAKVVGYKGVDGRSTRVTIYAEYGGVEYTCVAICKEEVAPPPMEDASGDNKPVISTGDSVTVGVGQSISFTVKDAEGKDITNTVSWTFDGSIASIDSTGVIKGLSAGTVTAQGRCVGGAVIAVTITVESADSGETN